jgi:hypothetical protein
MHPRSFSTLVAIVVGLLQVAAARAVTLYDGSLGTSPQAQGWLYLTDPFLGADATTSVGGSYVTLNTTADTSESAGWFNTVHPSSPTLNATAGYTVVFDAQVVNESASAAHRAGFSVIAISSDVSKAIEIGFWEDQVWAYDFSAPTTFTKSESVLLDTTAALQRFQLAILGSSYQLFADNTPILSGTLRDYSPRGLVYTNPNFLFFGDDTSQSASTTRIGYFGVLSTAIPEPGSAAVMLLPAAGGLMVRRRRAAGPRR